GGPTSLEKGWKVAALPELRNGNGQRAKCRVPGPLAIAVALVRSVGGSFSVGGPRQALDIDIHHSVDHERHHFPEEICVRPLLDKLRKVQSVDGHGPSPDLLVVANPSQPRFGP